MSNLLLGKMMQLEHFVCALLILHFGKYCRLWCRAHTSC